MFLDARANTKHAMRSWAHHHAQRFPLHAARRHGGSDLALDQLARHCKRIFERVASLCPGDEGVRIKGTDGRATKGVAAGCMSSSVWQDAWA